LSTKLNPPVTVTTGVAFATLTATGVGFVTAK
jgi:hypothetical protein